jgi:hypothetical protein
MKNLRIAHGSEMAHQENIRHINFGNSTLNIALINLIVLDLHFYDALNSIVQIGAPQYSSFD